MLETGFKVVLGCIVGWLLGALFYVRPGGDVIGLFVASLVPMSVACWIIRSTSWINIMVILITSTIGSLLGAGICGYSVSSSYWLDVELRLGDAPFSYFGPLTGTVLGTGAGAYLTFLWCYASERVGRPDRNEE